MAGFPPKTSLVFRFTHHFNIAIQIIHQKLVSTCTTSDCSSVIMEMSTKFFVFPIRLNAEWWKCGPAPLNSISISQGFFEFKFHRNIRNQLNLPFIHLSRAFKSIQSYWLTNNVTFKRLKPCNSQLSNRILRTVGEQGRRFNVQRPLKSA